MTPDQLREIAAEIMRHKSTVAVEGVVPQWLHDQLLAHAALLDERERLKAELENEVAIVNRIWAIYGNPDYETLNGRTIYDLINADRERAEKAERRAERLKVHAEELYHALGKVSSWEFARRARDAYRADKGE